MCIVNIRNVFEFACKKIRINDSMRQCSDPNDHKIDDCTANW